MKWVLWLVGLFAVAVGFALFAEVSKGYAILILPPYRVELSLNLMVVLLLAAVIATYLILRALSIALSLPERVKRFQRQKKLDAARHALRDATLSLFEGRYQKAEREAIKSVDNESDAQNRAIALLVAARAAHAVKDVGKRDSYLVRLENEGEAAELARCVSAAEFLLEDKQYVAARAVIDRARQLSPNLTAALRLELRLSLAQGAPDAVLALTEKLLKAEAISPEQARRYRLAAWRQQMGGLIDAEELKRWWSKIPAQERENDELRIAAAQHAHELGDTPMAVDFLTRRLDASYSSELAGELGRYVADLDDEGRLALAKRAEKWLETERRDPRLLLTLGRLAVAQKLWGKAQGYLEASATLDPALATHAELAKLFKRLDRDEEARRHFDECVRLALAQAG